MTRRATFTTTAIAIAAGVLGLSFARAQAQAPAQATMTLSASGGGCGKALTGNDGGSRVRVKRGGPVVWNVRNNCGNNAAVALGNWVRKANGSPDSPFDPSGRGSCSAASGGNCTIRLVVRGDAATTTYSYTVSINGAANDPDLIVEQ